MTTATTVEVEEVMKGSWWAKTFEIIATAETLQTLNGFRLDFRMALECE